MNPEPHRTDAFTDESAAEVAREHGFSLRSVTWGYRHIFAETIEELFRQGRLGCHRETVTRKFFELLKQADQSCFDHVIRQFLQALRPDNRWIMGLPGIFSDVVDLGNALARAHMHQGVRFFEALAHGGLGRTPAEVRQCLDWIRHLRETDGDLAMAFLAAYGQLVQRLKPAELARYVEAALQIHRRNPDNGCAFLRGDLRTSETYILEITQECRLIDVQQPLADLLRALTGTECEVEDLSGLDSDDLIERGTSTLTVSGHLYLPSRCRRFATTRENRNWYLLCGILSAAMLLEDSFPRIHGHPDYRNCGGLAGEEPGRANLLQVLEFVRVIRRARRRWPGLRRLLEWGTEVELGDETERGPEGLLVDALDPSKQTPELERIREIAESCVNCFDTTQRLDEPWAERVLAAYPSASARHIRPIAFLSDFLFPVAFSDPPSENLVADLKDAAKRSRRPEPEEAEQAALAEDGTGQDMQEDDETDEAEERVPAYVYDEWDVHRNDYRPDWCHLHVKPVSPAPRASLPAGSLEQARKVRTLFERLKPDLARREKYLPHGDEINMDQLLGYLVDRGREPDPPIRFYEKPIIRHRDLAVLVLLDVSGSTAEDAGGETKVLDVEKQAAAILAEGLATLDDRFAVCGFSSSGREQCEYLLLKHFDDAWSDEALGRVMACRARGSTRIGPALRHSGRMLALQPNRQRLIILVTDGKPMDAGYEPATRYAQHDVRMACEENARHDVHTFAISTRENSLADMEIMFPRRRFVILPTIEHLPHLLPDLYLRLTL